MILVTGGAGYVGSHFVKTYLEQRSKNRVVVIDNLTTGHREAVPASERAILVVGDIGDTELAGKTLSQYPIEAVVHFAAKVYVGESQSDPFGYLHNNVAQSISFFETMEKHAVRKIVFSSSCAVYGDPQYLPLDEEHRREPTSVYGATKLLVEQILSSFTESLGWSSVALRYFNAAGASDEGELGESHDPELHLIPNLLRAATGKLDFVTINGTDYQTKDGTCIRDYVHVNDLALAHLRALELLQSQDNPSSSAINLGSSQGFSILEVLSACEEVAKRKIPRRDSERRPGDAPALVANASKAEKLLDWKASRGLKEMIQSAWNWELSRRY
jgi:UDP-glucose-4-epimerase GalE